LDGPLNTNTLFPHLDALKTQLEPYVTNDPQFPEDYGFSLADFNQSFDESVDYWFIPYGIKSHLEARSNSASQQLVLNDIPPILEAPQHNNPEIDENVIFTIRALDDRQVQSVELHYATYNQVKQIAPMFDDGLHNDGAANDGVFGVELAAFNENLFLNYSVEALDNMNQRSTYPRCATRQITVGNPIVDTQEKQNFPISLYPNPASDQVWLDWDDSSLSNLDWKIFDLNGEKLLQGNLPFGEKMISLSALANGIYMIQWSSKNWEGISREKLVVCK